jgi:hypothetical protein
LAYRVIDIILLQTLRDGISTCRALGIPYLWVDSICIIQDDLGERDWYEQCGEMHQIYLNATLAIAAEDAANYCNGFLPDVHTKEVASHRHRDEHVRVWSMILVPPAFGKPNILSTRGWALQEKLLPPRTLRFTGEGMIWECNRMYRHERSSKGIDSLYLAFRALRLMVSGKSFIGPPDMIGNCAEEEDEVHSQHITQFLTSGSFSSIHYAWQLLVEDYSGRSLANPADKLIAISGLASMIAPAIPSGTSSYVAGLWKGNLAQDLLWYVASAASRPVYYAAPSWSWASVMGRVAYFREQHQFRFEPDVAVSEASCETCPVNPTGRVYGGQIKLRGRLAPVSLSVLTSPKEPTRYKGYNGCAGRVYQDRYVYVHRCNKGQRKQQYEVLLDEWMPLVQEGPCREDVHNDGRCEYTEADLGTRQFCCVSIALLHDPKCGGIRHWWLVLERTVSGDNEFKRIGIGYCQFRAAKFDLFDGATYREIVIV